MNIKDYLCKSSSSFSDNFTSVNDRLGLQRFNKYHAYEYSQMYKSMNKVLGHLYN